MSNYIATSTELTSVADAIRAKGGTSSSLSFPTGWINAINDISSGPSSSDAVIRVAIYNGSTVTMVKGNTTLVPTKRILADNNQYEVALFIVTSDLFDSVNLWAISSVGDYTYSENILINSNKDYYVELTHVPIEYQEVEFLTCTNSSTQYIGIGITPYQVHGGTFSYKLSSNAAAWTYVWGAGSNGSSSNASGSLGLGAGTSAKGLNYGSTQLASNAYTSGIKYEGSFSCENGSQSQTTNGSTVTGNGTQTPTNAREIVIFGFSTAGSVSNNRFYGSIYYLTFTDENGNLLRDLVPCYRKSDSVAGMWDRVTKTFMSPTAGGVLLPGPVVINGFGSLKLYYRGSFLSGYERNDITTNGTITLNSDYITLHSNSSSKAYVYVRWIAVDLTSYSYISAFFDNVTSANIFGAIWISDSESVNVYGDSVSYNHTQIDSSTSKTLTLDVSNITGTYYLGVGIDTNDGSWSNARNVNLYSVIIY